MADQLDWHTELVAECKSNSLRAYHQSLAVNSYSCSRRCGPDAPLRLQNRIEIIFKIASHCIFHCSRQDARREKSGIHPDSRLTSPTGQMHPNR